MNKSVKQIIFIFIVLVIILGFSATLFAGKNGTKNIVVNFPDGSQINITSKKENSLEILEDNNIILLDNEIVENEKIENNSINVKSLKSIMKTEKKVPVLKTSKIEKEYENTVEKIEVEEISIPYETIERVAEGYNSSNGRSVIVQKGEEGLKQIKYRTIYTNNVLNQRKKLSEEVIKNPTNQIIQKSISRTRTYSSVNIPAGESRNAFEQIVAEKGISESDKNKWAKLIQRESGWNATNVNRSSGAYGLPQALPGSKMSSHGSDWKTNPKTQLRWMYDYMIGRYGSISNALGHSDRRGWY